MRQVDIGGLRASDWSLGTMTFGNQTPQDDAHRQMDMALAAGVTLWDCAEMYPVNPVRRETVGRSEAIIGSWLASRGGRDRVVLATKVAGPGSPVRAEGYGTPVLERACEASLRRLNTEVIDLYQLHWPERGTYAWRQHWDWRPPSNREETLAHMDDVLGALSRLVERGKVREVGLSNETAWGTCRWLDRAEATGAPRMVSVQNEYSLLDRLYDADMAEATAMEGLALLAYSPLAAGLLTGKYLDGAVPPGSRKALNGTLSGRAAPRTDAAVRAYHALAAEAGMDPVHMALAWHRTRPFPSLPIFGATTADQLARILKGLDAAVPPDLARAIDEAHRQHPLPF